MEATPDESPLKVCPHCSVATRTEADVCPSCGGSYVRDRRMPRLRWSWWFAIPIVAAAFLVGYFGISRVVDGDESGEVEGEITLHQARDLPASASQGDVEETLGEPAVERAPRENSATTCIFYSLSDQPDTLWQFCFQRGELVSSAPVTG